MKNDKNLQLEFENHEVKTQQSDLRVALMFGFTLGFAFAMLLILFTLEINGKL